MHIQFCATQAKKVCTIVGGMSYAHFSNVSFASPFQPTLQNQMCKDNEELDKKYGIVVLPTRRTASEVSFRPKSVFEFDDEGSCRLKNLIDLVEDEYYFSYCLYSDFTILWLIDRGGKLIISLEETLIDGQSSGSYPLPRFVDRQNPIRERKLGHPALVGGEGARIGGELKYDPMRKDWYLSNASGRYGVNLGRTEEQLEEVAKLFRNRGFRIETDFI